MICSDLNQLPAASRERVQDAIKKAGRLLTNRIRLDKLLYVDTDFAERIHGLLHDAANEVMGARSGCSLYQARSVIMQELWNHYPETIGYKLSPETHLELPADFNLENNEVDFGEIRVKLMELGTFYEQCSSFPSSPLPIEVISALCTMVGAFTLSCAHSGLPSPAGILSHQGAFVACPALSYLGTIPVGIWQSHWFYPHAVSEFAKLASGWPKVHCELFFTLALEAGWNVVGRQLPDSDWGRALREKFAISPYGPPALA